MLTQSLGSSYQSPRCAFTGQTCTDCEKWGKRGRSVQASHYYIV